uniref:Uncharacterized protein n=1 Tax=Arundo donax TaxID=35708 RepID=A0A0A8Z7Z8_ARUDO
MAMVSKVILILLGPARPAVLQDLDGAGVAERVRRPASADAEVPEAALGGDEVVLA